MTFLCVPCKLFQLVIIILIFHVKFGESIFLLIPHPFFSSSNRNHLILSAISGVMKPQIHHKDEESSILPDTIGSMNIQNYPSGPAMSLAVALSLFKMHTILNAITSNSVLLMLNKLAYIFSNKLRWGIPITGRQAHSLAFEIFPSRNVGHNHANFGF